jgi:hypothetical protein
MLNKKYISISIMVIITTFILGSLIFPQNIYEEKFIGKWEVPEETNIYVFSEDNIVYIEDIDGIRVTENGRWKATSDKVSIELKYNGRRYRMVYEYEFVNEDKVNVTVIKALEDGQPMQNEEFQLGETYTMTRWKPNEDDSSNDSDSNE